MWPCAILCNIVQWEVVSTASKSEAARKKTRHVFNIFSATWTAHPPTTIFRSAITQWQDTLVTRAPAFPLYVKPHNKQDSNILHRRTDCSPTLNLILTEIHPTLNLIVISDQNEACSSADINHLPQTLFWWQWLEWDTLHSMIEPPCPKE